MQLQVYCLVDCTPSPRHAVPILHVLHTSVWIVKEYHMQLTQNLTVLDAWLSVWQFCLSRSSSRFGARTPSSMMFLSPNPASRANQHVKSPFKHAVPKKKDFDDSSTYSVNILLLTISFPRIKYHVCLLVWLLSWVYMGVLKALSSSPYKDLSFHHLWHKLISWSYK